MSEGVTIATVEVSIDGLRVSNVDEIRKWLLVRVKLLVVMAGFVHVWFICLTVITT